MAAVFEVGVRYQVYHSIALIATAWVQSKWPSAILAAAGWLFAIGTMIFSDSLYLLALSGVRGFGAITPVGGLACLGGWACLAWGALNKGPHWRAPVPCEMLLCAPAADITLDSAVPGPAS